MSDSTETTVDFFTGEYAYLSNFYEAAFAYEGIVYPTVEHAFQAQKTFDDGERRRIAAARSAGSAKRMGRGVKLRKDWESVKVGLMRDLVRLKFTTHPDLAEWLLATGDAKLVEGNSWNDRFWGVAGGVGKNHLGRILMDVRSELAADDGLPDESVPHPR